MNNLKNMWLLEPLVRISGLRNMHLREPTTLFSGIGCNVGLVKDSAVCVGERPNFTTLSTYRCLWDTFHSTHILTGNTYIDQV